MKKRKNSYDDGFYVYTDVEEEPENIQVYSSKESLFEWLEVVVTAITVSYTHLTLPTKA